MSVTSYRVLVLLLQLELLVISSEESKLVFSFLEDGENESRGRGENIVKFYRNTNKKRFCSLNYRLHNDTQKCVEIGSKAVCGANMAFYSLDSRYGDCECDFLQSPVPLIYHDPDAQCYPIFTQAFCKRGEWLVWTKEGNKPTFKCVHNPCADAVLFDVNDVIVEFLGKCVLLNKHSNLCDSPDEVVSFLEDSVFLSCVKPEDTIGIGFHSLFNTRRLKCPPGSRRDFRGKCRKAMSRLSDRSHFEESELHF